MSTVKDEMFKCPYCDMVDHYLPLVKASRSEEELEIVLSQIIDEASALGSLEVELGISYYDDCDFDTCENECEDFCVKCVNNKDYEC